MASFPGANQKSGSTGKYICCVAAFLLIGIIAVLSIVAIGGFGGKMQLSSPGNSAWMGGGTGNEITVIGNTYAEGAGKSVSNDDDCIKKINSKALEYINKVNEMAKKYNQDPALMLAQLEAESGFTPNAVSPVGAQGIAQFMPGTWSWIASQYNIDGNNNGTENPYEPEDGIYAQAVYNVYIQNYLSENGVKPTIENVLASYNAGEGAVVKYGGVPPYTETRNYVKTILKYYNDYKKCLKG